MSDDSIPAQLALAAPAPDLDLFETGLLDSLSFAQLLVALEKEFDIRFAVEDIDLDRFRTLPAVTDVVTRAIAAGAAVAGS